MQNSRRAILIRESTVLTLDPLRGIWPRADILIEQDRISAIGPKLSVTDAEVIDASNMIAMPGFVDSHRHMWPGAMRHQFPNDTVKDYFTNVLIGLGLRCRPEDVYIGNLISALSAIDAGVTTALDWSHISNTPQHSDAAIEALKASGMRAVYGFGGPQLGIDPWDESRSHAPVDEHQRHRYPVDIRRLRRQYFSSEDQLLTLALAADGPHRSPVETAIAEWEIAREVGARISVHMADPDTLPKLVRMRALGLLQPDTTYIHCTNMPAEAWQIIKETGGTVSLAPTAEMEQAALPAILDALDHGFRPSLSVDAETDVPNDMFTQMRLTFAVQRALEFERVARGERDTPSLLKVEDVLEFATLAGAKAVGLESKIGSLAVGKQADLVLLRKDRMNVLPVKDVVGSTVLGMDTGNVDSVFVAGRALKRGGALVGVDLRSISRRAEASQEYLCSAKGLPA